MPWTGTNPGTASPQVLYTIISGIKETTYGVIPSTGTSTFHPVMQPNFQPRALRHILDEGLRGTSASAFDLLPGPGEGTVGFGGTFHLDTTPHLLQSLIGPDVYTTSGTGATAYYQHVFLPPTSGLPSSHTYQYQNDVATFNFPGTRIQTLRLTFNSADGALQYTAQGMSKLATKAVPGAVTPSGKQTAAFTLNQAMTGWQGAVQIDGASFSMPITEGELTLTRQLTPAHSLTGTQDVFAIYPGPLQMELRLTMDYTSMQANDYFAGDFGETLAPGASGAAPAGWGGQPAGFVYGATNLPITITFTQNPQAGVGSTPTTGEQSMAISMQRAAWRNVETTMNGALYTQTATIVALNNAVDRGPGKFTIKNSQAVAY